MRAKVTVYPRREVLDPRGKAIHQALHRIGFDEVAGVRAGRCFEVELDCSEESSAREQLEQMCERLLANTIVEDFEFELVEAQGDAG